MKLQHKRYLQRLAAACLAGTMALSMISCGGGQQGDKNLITRLAEVGYANCADKKAPTVVVYGSAAECGEEMSKAISKRFGHPPKALWQAGAAIVINAGPKVVGLIVRGKKRLNTRAREQDYEQV